MTDIEETVDTGEMTAFERHEFDVAFITEKLSSLFYNFSFPAVTKLLYGFWVRERGAGGVICQLEVECKIHGTHVELENRLTYEGKVTQRVSTELFYRTVAQINERVFHPTFYKL